MSGGVGDVPLWIGHFKEMTFGLRSACWEGSNERMREDAAGGGNNMCKGPEVRTSLACFRNRRLVRLE